MCLTKRNAHQIPTFLLYHYLLTYLLTYILTYILTYYLLIYLLTYPMEHSPSEATRFSASQEIPHIWWNPNFHYCIHRYLPPVPILRHIGPVLAPTSHFLKIHLIIIILPSTLVSSKWPLSPRFLHQNPVYTSPPYVPFVPPSSFFTIWSLGQ